MHGVSAHSNLERLVTDSIGFSVLRKALIYLVIVIVRGNPAYLSSAKHDLHITRERIKPFFLQKTCIIPLSGFFASLFWLFII